ncbi:hypothetical protein TL18_02365 [Methanobrevibacter sp. YE315]|uniref:alpha/beta fold hydrolase n=1 Tax=Methanobrevibacter sp. YE315 TaxID=1609968 RepID=UPI000764D0BE|nr:alpha/beta fold hydrolase [Methanobrevibacter sp. YE315]AMD16968.1 hypothetical protein TL18_02365 [Methanobrevibacter sp. YE315]
MESFEFESGDVLENVDVEYRTKGIPRFDDEGNITNAIIFCPTLKGGHSVLAKFQEYLKRHGNFDDDEYFFITVISLGVPDSCSPSSTGLKNNFPKYTFLDCVNFKKQFLKEKFNITNIFGLLGEGSGGFEIFTWACEYPDDMEWIIVLNSSFKTSGYFYIFVKWVKSLIESSDDFNSGGYDVSLSNLVVSINILLFSGYLSRNIISNASVDELDVLIDDFVDEGLYTDIYDFNSHNDCIAEYDVEDKLSNIKAKSLFIGAHNYLFVDVDKDMLPLKDLVDNSEVVSIYPNQNHYYEEEDYFDGVNAIISFLNEFKK